MLRGVSGGGSGSSIAVAPGWRPTPPTADLYAIFGATPNYYGGGAQTGVFATWLTSVSGTFTRSGSVAPYWNSSGNLANGSANQPRLSYDPVTLVPNLLYEPAASNLFTYTQDSSNSVWSFGNVGIGTRTANAAVGLDGGTTAGIFREAATNTQHYVYHYDSGLTLTSGLFYAESYYIRPVNRTRMKVQITGGRTATIFYLDFTNVTTTNPNWSFVKLANGFYCLSQTFTATASAVPGTLFYTIDTLGNETFLGSTAAGWDLGGAQMEQVATATSPFTTYIARLAATAASRSADLLSFTLPSGASSLTYTFANGRTQTVSVAPGAYSVPTNLSSSQIASFVDVDLAQAAAPVLSVAGRTGNVLLSQSDIAGLRSTDIAFHAGLSLSASRIDIGTATAFPSFIRTEGQLYHWGNDGPVGLGGSSRYILIGSQAGKALLPASQNNAVCIGTAAAISATSIATSVVIGDTAGAAATSINNSVLIGNEGGNAQGTVTVSTSNIIGNLAGRGNGGSTNISQTDIMGASAFQFNTATSTVGIGYQAGYGNSGGGQNRVINQSVLLGALTGTNFQGAGTSSNVILIGYNIQPSTATVSNEVNIGNVFKGDMSGGTYSMTTSAGGNALLTVANLLLSSLPTSSPGVTGRVWNNAGVLNISP
jgi:hypothetical protein